MQEKTATTHRFRYKQAIVIRKDIKMSPGKSIAQGAHVSVLAAVKVKETDPKLYDEWTAEGHAKIVLRVESLGELDSIMWEAKNAGIVAFTIADFGLTELEPGTVTALAIGPARVDQIEPITKKMKLL